MKVMLFDGKLYEVIDVSDKGWVRGYRLKADRTRSQAHKFPITFPLKHATKLDGYHEEGTGESRRKIQEFIAGLSFAERIILAEEVNHLVREKNPF